MFCIDFKFHVFPSRLCVTMTGPVDVVSHAIDILVCAFPSEGRTTTVGGMPSVSVDSAACLGSATAAFPVDKKVKRRNHHGVLFVLSVNMQLKRSVPRPGARCKVDRDCDSSMCCARHHGERVCKRRLIRGESCYIPDGGLAFSINQICPCDEGLLCRDNSAPHRTEWVQQTLNRRYWAHCQPHIAYLIYTGSKIWNLNHF